MEERGDLSRSDARSLAQLFGVDGEGRDLWGPEELGAVLRHQLAAPLEVDLGPLDQGPRRRLDALRTVEGPPITTFSDLFHHPQPPLELLDLAKEFARTCTSRREGSLPEEVATLLYLLSIVVARVRWGRRITGLDDQTLRSLRDWAISLPWIDPATRHLLLQTDQVLETPVPEGTLGADVSRPPPFSRVSAGPEGSGVRATGQPERLGEYMLLEKLGEGGMGAVYKALHTELDRLVALKVLSPDRMRDPQAIARFKRETKALGRLDHPHLVRAHDAREIDGTHFLVMEYVDGLDLSELVSRLGPLPLADACELVRQAALGLQFAHEHGLVHRDVKPSNLMLSRQGQVKVLDLGLARICTATPPDDQATASGMAMGTPDYMAPEQVSDSRQADIRADIYSLGCTLYMLLAGWPPFSGPTYRTAFDKMTAHVREPIPDIRQFRDDLPEDFLAILERMLAKDVDSRFATPGEVSEAIGRFAAGCDLPGLTARALHTSIAPAGEASPDARTQRPSGRTPARTPAAPPASPRSEWQRAYPWWQRPRTIVAGLLVAALAGMIVGAMMIRHNRQMHRPVVHRDAHAPAAVNGQRPTVPAAQPPRPRIGGPVGMPPGWIVASWSRPGLGKPDLWRLRPDGTGMVRIMMNPRYFHIQPSFSPDGRRIAFIRGESLTGPTSVCTSDAEGGNFREVVRGRDAQERFVSPVWVSNSRLYFTCDPKRGSTDDMEIRQVDLDGGPAQTVFRFQDAMGKGAGLTTDASPDGRQLAVIALRSGLWSTADVFITDLHGKVVQKLGTDVSDDGKDGRAIWSRDGQRIAWHHDFTPAARGRPGYYGVGLARREADGRWAARLQPDAQQTVTPLAWSPDSRYLLCARFAPSSTRATLLLMDGDFRTVRELFALEAACWQPSLHDFGRWADWAIVPADAHISERVP